MSTGTAEKKLTAKQEQFCLEYIIDFNATQAAIRAGYSEKTAHAMGAENLTKPLIAAKLAQLIGERQKRARKTGDDVIRELENIAFSRLGDVVHWNESGMAFPVGSEDLDDDAMAAVEAVEVTEIVGKKEDSNDMLKTKVKLHAKLPALTLLAKHHGLANDKLDVSGDISIQITDYKGKSGKVDEE
jgi:phage terminase small subunit